MRGMTEARVLDPLRLQLNGRHRARQPLARLLRNLTADDLMTVRAAVLPLEEFGVGRSDFLTDPASASGSLIGADEGPRGALS